MKRRTVLSGLGASAATGGIVFGTGAFTSITADRTATIEVASEDEALLAMFPSEGPNAEYATQDEDNRNEIGLSFDDEQNGGLGQNSTYAFGNVFIVENRGTQTVSITATIDGIDSHTGIDSFALYDTDTSDNSQFSAESGDDATGIAVAPGERIRVGVRGETSGNQKTGVDAELSITINADATGSTRQGEQNSTDTTRETSTASANADTSGS